jgi:glycosyltransferase involved in cell wall biosynthesis
MISVIIPIHNEADILLSNIGRLRDALEALSGDYEIIIAEDGSSDGSFSVAQALESESIRLLTSDTKLGRGLALSNAIRQAEGDIVVYMDADLSTDLRYLAPLMQKMNEGADLSTGSRLMEGSEVIGRSLLREVMSRWYNILLRLLFGTRVKDHQCGFKAFRKNAVLQLLDEVEDRHWFWDSELLIRAQMKGLRISEIPVSWVDRSNSKVKLHLDVFYMLFSALGLRFRI